MLKKTSAFDLKSSLRLQLDAAVGAFEALPPDEAIHRGRVALKRARTLARMAQGAEPALAGQLIAQVRPVMRRFSEARDLAALEACAVHWAAVENAQARAALNGVAKRLAARRKALAEADLSGAAEDVRRLVFYLSAWPEISDEAVVRGAARLARRARKGYRRAVKSKRPELRHEWRKRAKERFYAILMLDQFWPHGLKRRRTLSQKVGETLGQERDVTLLLEHLRVDATLAGSPDQADRAHAALSARRDELAKRADKLGKRAFR